LTHISDLLARIGTPGSFALRRTTPAGDLKLEVRGVGRIRFPITATAARKLCAVARPARHGFKDQTRLDTRVRDTWEIPRSRISIDLPSWQKTLAPQLERIRTGLGLPKGARLKAELHNLLIYAPGQFFVTHQDSEKADDMIGTLVVSLPARFTGGTMVIKHHDEELRVGGSDQQLTFIAFYADCHHEVRPITQGYRIVLTYNLILEKTTGAVAVPADRVAALTLRVREFFDTPAAPRWKADRQSSPDRLVYLLDHQYTLRGLAWSRLKSADAERAAALEQVARALDCEIGLALADVHETWSCEEEYGHYESRWRRRYYEEDEDDAEDGGGDSGSTVAPELTDLIDSDVELRHWVGAHGRPKVLTAGVGGDELCYTKPSVELEPFKSEHEGYMGNYGNTVDRWYHRAAVVLWPRERTFVIRAKTSPMWGVGEIAKTLRRGDVATALGMARRVLPFWAHAVRLERKPNFADRTLQVSVQLADPEIAAALLDPFTITSVKSKAAPRLVALLERYGLQWCRTLMRAWLSEKRHDEAPEARLAGMSATLPALCRSLCGRRGTEGQTLAQELLEAQWAWLLAHLKDLQQDSDAKELAKNLASLCKPVLAIIEGSRIAQSALHGRVLNLLMRESAGLPLQVSLGVLRAAHQASRTNALRQLGLSPLHAHCLRQITARVEAPARAKDDWSIATQVRCPCKLCATLTGYLRASKQVRLEWPLAQGERGHIHGIIESSDVPVRHTTRRTGRPFTLVLEKTETVFARDTAERRRWQEEFVWLTKTAKSC
jgi:hypothetical protein